MLLQQNSVAHYRTRLYECLNRQPGVEFEFVADLRSDTPYMPTASEVGTSLRLTPAPLWKVRLWRSLEFFLQPRALARLLVGEFDVAIALGSPYSLTTWLMLLVGPLVGTRVLLWTHGILAPESGPKWWVRSALYRASSGLLLYGERSKRLLSALGLDQAKLHVVKNSLDPDAQVRAEATLSRERVAALRSRLGLRAQDRVIVFIGRLQPVKQLDLVVRALAALSARGHRVHALLLGDGHERDALEQLAFEQGVEEFVHFEGAHYEEARIAEYFALSDVCFIPSGAGLTVMHALGYGTPVVTHDRPELQFPEVEAIVSGKTGQFYREGDFDDMVDVLEDCLFPRSMKDWASSTCRARIAKEFHPQVQAQRMTEAVLWAAGRGGVGPSA